MTPEEKAKELVEKFRIKVGSYVDEDGTTINQYLLSKSNAKKAAILCVEEILASSDHPGGWDTYWQTVLSILKNMKQ